jgi:hypothetical protein
MIGLHTVPDRYGRPMRVLAWSDGTRAAAEGKDLAAVARGLTMAELHWWADHLERLSNMHEARTLRAEIDRRDPDGRWGTLWQFAET